MKYLRFFENLENINEPQPGDYVQMKVDTYDENINNFINNTFGRLSSSYHESYTVIYTNVPKNIKIWFSAESYGKCRRTFDKDRLVDFGKTEEELELKLSANKYNL